MLARCKPVARGITLTMAALYQLSYVGVARIVAPRRYARRGVVSTLRPAGRGGLGVRMLA
jgi:hypothetical protein